MKPPYRINLANGKELKVVYADMIGRKGEAEKRLEYGDGPFSYSDYDVTTYPDKAILTLHKEADGDLYKAAIYNQGEGMTNEYRRLLVETLGEMKELKGEMKEFKEQVIERVNRLEKKETEQTKKTVFVLSLLISGAALTVSVLVNFLKVIHKV
jgi:hypothetical protein